MDDDLLAASKFEATVASSTTSLLSLIGQLCCHLIERLTMARQTWDHHSSLPEEKLPPNDVQVTCRTFKKCAIAISVDIFTVHLSTKTYGCSKILVIFEKARIKLLLTVYEYKI